MILENTVTFQNCRSSQAITDINLKLGRIVEKPQSDGKLSNFYPNPFSGVEIEKFAECERECLFNDYWPQWLIICYQLASCEFVSCRDNFWQHLFNYWIITKVCSINFEPPDIDLCSACHVYPFSRGASIISILLIMNRFTWGLN